MMSNITLSCLLGWLVNLQERYETVIHLKLYEDGEGAVVHQPYDDEEYIILVWDNLEELTALMKAT
jgi:hypothetical protein